jgi:hypothetical protein
MSCQGFDWKAYALDEFAGAEKKRYDEHLRDCAACQEEVEQLQGTLLLIHRLPVAEPPRRIAFVSDPVFEPSWWQRLWASGPRLAFAGSGVLAAAIIAHGFIMKPPLPVSAPAPVVAQVDDKRVQEEVDRRVGAALQRAVADLRVEQSESTLRLVASLEKKMNEQRQRDLREVDNSFSYLQKQMGNLYVNTSRMGGD